MNSCFAVVEDITKPLILYLPPPSTTEVMKKHREEASDTVKKGFKTDFRVHVLEPPERCSDTDICTWINATSKSQTDLIKKVRKRTLFSLVYVLSEAVRWRPHLNLGTGQFGMIALLLGQPLLVEWACRHRAVSGNAVCSFRNTLTMVQGLVGIDPCVARDRTTAELFDKALPEAIEMQQETSLVSL